VHAPNLVNDNMHGIKMFDFSSNDIAARQSVNGACISSVMIVVGISNRLHRV